MYRFYAEFCRIWGDWRHVAIERILWIWMGSFLRAVEGFVLDPDLLKEVGQFSDAQGWTEPFTLEGVQSDDANTLRKCTIDATAFLRCALECAGSVAAAKRGASVSSDQTKAQPEQKKTQATSVKLRLSATAGQEVSDAAGTDASAALVASVLTSKVNVDVPQLLHEAGLACLPVIHRAEAEVRKILVAEGKATRVQTRKGFAYIGLTSPGMLHSWLPSGPGGGTEVLGCQ